MNRLLASCLGIVGVAAATYGFAWRGASAASDLSQAPLRFPNDRSFSSPPPLPSGRVFGPDGPDLSSPSLGRGDAFDGAPSGRSRRAAAKPRDKAAESADSAPDEDPQALRQRLLADLFQRLKNSSDDDEAEGVAGAIERVWFESGSDTADLLMGRALVAEQTKHYKVSRALLSKIVEIDPGWAEAWNELAVTRALSDDPDGAMADLAHVLAIEPRHFGALTGMATLLLESGDKKGALKVFRRVLQLYPRLAPVRAVVDRLTIEVEGRDL